MSTRSGTYTATVRIDGVITAAAREAMEYVRKIARQTRGGAPRSRTSATGAGPKTSARAPKTPWPGTDEPIITRVAGRPPAPRSPATSRKRGPDSAVAEMREAARQNTYWRGLAEKSRAVRERAEQSVARAAGRSAQQQQRAADRAAGAKARAAQRAEAAARRATDNEARAADRLAAHWRSVSERSRAARERAEQRVTATAEREANKRMRIAEREAKAKDRAVERARVKAEREAKRAEKNRRRNRFFGSDGTLDRMANANQGMELVGRIGRAVTAPITSAVGVTIDFEDQMIRVGALSEATADQMTALTEEAKRLGAVTRYSATEAAQGMEELAQAGFKPKQQIAAMGGVLKLAAAGNTSIAETAGIAAATLGGFGLEASEMGRVADVMAKASSDSKITLLDLGETMKYVAPIAKTAGSNIEVAAAATALMGNAGIEASQAGTALRAMFTRLAAPPKKARSALTMLGIDTLDKKGNLKPFETLTRDIGEAIKKKGLGKGEKLAVLNAIFGQEALSGAAELVEQAGTGALDEWIGKLRGAAGTSDTLAKRMSMSARGSVEEMKGAYESLQLEIGGALIPTVKGLSVELAQSSRDIGAWAKENKGQVEALGESFRALASVAIGSLGLLAKSFIGYQRGFEKLGLWFSETNWGPMIEGTIGHIIKGTTGNALGDEMIQSAKDRIKANQLLKDADIYGIRYTWQDKGKPSEDKAESPSNVIKLEPVEITPRAKPKRAETVSDLRHRRAREKADHGDYSGLQDENTMSRRQREEGDASFERSVPPTRVDGEILVRVEDNRTTVKVTQKPQPGGGRGGPNISTKAGPLAAGGWG